ncbi:unnamed protein product [Peniophora sp. CBMAI 1063]|nr:unnamed protein product [Peniophora sp. CBMAI 1063]
MDIFVGYLLFFVMYISNVGAPSSYYGPDEDGALILRERSFLASDLISGFGYGIQFALYTTCAHYLWSQRQTRRYALVLLAYTSIAFCIQTVYVAVQARVLQHVYIDDRNYPGGPWAYYLSSQSIPVNIVVQVTLFVLTFMCDVLVLWRCWVIWQAPWQSRRVAYLVASVPLVLLLASFATGILWALSSSRTASPSTLYPALPKAYGIAYTSTSFSINILLTLLITGRLLQYRANIMSSLPAAYAKHYLSLATALVESAALYSVFAVAFLVSYAVDSGLDQVFLAVAQAAQQVSAYMIVYRLANGMAWETTTLANDLTSTISALVEETGSAC